MIPEELKQYIGKQYAPHVREVEKGAIRRYAEAIDDDNPIYCDEEYATKSSYGTIIAPPGFFGWAKKRADVAPKAIIEVWEATMKAGYGRLLDGGISYEFNLPVREGDTLVASMKVKDIYEREGKSGTKMIFPVFETTYINQNGDIVAKACHTMISR